MSNQTHPLAAVLGSLFTEMPPTIKRYDLVNFLDDIVDSLTFDELDEATKDKVVKAIKKRACAVFGHYLTVDQCGMPAHDFCMTCNETADALGFERKLNENVWKHKTT